MAFTPQPAIAWDDVEWTLSKWAADMSGLTTVWAEQDAPQPARPYVTLDWLVYPEAKGEDYFSLESVTATKEVRRVRNGVRLATLTVRVNTAPVSAASGASWLSPAYADKLVDSLNSDTVVAQYFAPYRMAPAGASNPRKEDWREDGHAVSRTAFDLRINFAAGTGAASETVGYITGASLTGTINTPAVALTSAMAITS